MTTPVCLIEGGADGLRVTEEGMNLLESLNEPVAIICLAGQYRTGKSFFLNQLASQRNDLPWIDTANRILLKDGNAHTNGCGFRVGPTTESCTRGIWLWAPQPPVRNPAGELVLFLDTEGLASTDNDESYDAKIFALGLLLSSLFVFNTMGVIDESAIDRLYLVSELTKHVCVSTHSTKALSLTTSLGGEGTSLEEQMLSSDKREESRALAPHFPPFVWLLRDFLLDMEIDGNTLTANEYLEKALDARDVSLSASESTRIRQEERNRTRASIRVLFGRRECLTLVRPVTDERDLRRAAELSDAELRAEFVEQMSVIRRRLLSSVAAKELLGKVLNGANVAQLVRCYVDTMNSGRVPDIKAAWEYVSEATCQAALDAAIELYDSLMRGITGKKPLIQTNDEGLFIESDNGEGNTEDGGSDDETRIVSQVEFVTVSQDAQEQALALYKSRSVEGATRTVCFQKLKQHMQAERAKFIAQLQRRSSKMCVKVLAKLRAKFLVRPLAAGAWDAAAHKEEAFQATLKVLEEVYERKACGPAKKKAFYQFLRVDLVEFFEALFQRIMNNHEQEQAEWSRLQKELEELYANIQLEGKQQLQDKTREVQQLQDTKLHLEEKVAGQAERIAEMQFSSQDQSAAIAVLEKERNSLNKQMEQLNRVVVELTKELEKTQVRLQHKEETLVKVESEAQLAKQALTQQVELLRQTHQKEREDWIRRAADQVAEKSMLQKHIKETNLHVQQQERKIELLDLERRQLQQLYDAEVEAQAQLRQQYDKLCDDNEELKRQIKQITRQQVTEKETAKCEQERLKARLQRFQMQLGGLEGGHEVAEVLRDCVADVAHQVDKERITTLQEERRVLQQQLGDLHEKISTLPDFYVRQIFCAPEPVTSFFDAMTSVVVDPRKW